MWSFLNNSRGPLTVSPPNNNHPAVTKVAGFHVSNYSRGILDLASNPCHKQFPDFINRSNSASELVVCSGEKLSPDTVNRSKSASELSMGGKSDDGSPSRAAASSATSSPAKAEKPASPSPKKRRCNLQKQQQQQEEQTQQQSEEAVAVPAVESGDEEDDDSSSDEDMVPLKVKQRNDSITSEDSFIIFEDSSDGADEEEEDDESDESDTESEDSDSDSSGDETAEEICFENSPRCASCVTTTSKKVHWAPDAELCSVTQITTWPQAHYEARISPWLIMAVDTMRFKTRILSTQSLLDDVLSTQHRAKIYEERFKNQD